MNWNEDDLEALIENQIEERLDLEYKASDSLLNLTDNRKKEEVGKDVSAMANAQGGIIIYGITENKQGDGFPGIPKKLDGKLNPREISKERLENIILSNVAPRISNLQIKTIQLNKIAPENVAYLVSIPQSHIGHQAKDKRYYKRFNFSNTPMDDYEIRDVMNRSRYPLISIKITSDRASTSTLRISLKNEGAIAARNMKLVLYWPPEIQISGHHLEGFQTSGKEKIDGEIYDVYIGYLNTRCLFPDDEAQITNFGKFRFGYNNLEKYQNAPSTDPCLDRSLRNALNLKWKIFADDMPPQMGQIDDIYQIPIHYH